MQYSQIICWSGSWVSGLSWELLRCCTTLGGQTAPHSVPGASGRCRCPLAWAPQMPHSPYQPGLAWGRAQPPPSGLVTPRPGFPTWTSAIETNTHGPHASKATQTNLTQERVDACDFHHSLTTIWKMHGYCITECTYSIVIIPLCQKSSWCCQCSSSSSTWWTWCQAPDMFRLVDSHPETRLSLWAPRWSRRPWDPWFECTEHCEYSFDSASVFFLKLKAKRFFFS